mmetsp:Transcript_55483/g.130230  ORF Transcript_55483/g.130230 Transcript_55483/m.130230 type:complete len:260 (+) Transcript_55483:875-1654(+)
MRFVTEKLHDHVAPCERTHRHPTSLDHIALLDLHCNFREAQEDLHLHHQTSELCTSVYLHVKGTDLYFVAQIVDVVVQAAEILGGQHAEVRRSQCLVVRVEGTELLVQVHDGLQVKNAFHHMRQRCGKGDATIAGGAQDAMWIRVVVLRLQVPLLLARSGFQILKVRQHWIDGVCEHLLDLLLHVLHEIPETDCAHVEVAEALGGHLVAVLRVLLVLDVIEGFGHRAGVRPPRKGHCKPHQGVWEISEAIHPLAHIVRR